MPKNNAPWSRPRKVTHTVGTEDPKPRPAGGAPDYSRLEDVKKVLKQAFEWHEEHHVDGGRVGRSRIDGAVNAKKAESRVHPGQKPKRHSFNKFNAETAYKFCALVKTGSYFTPAAKVLGLHVQSVFYWLRKGRDEALKVEENPYRAFYVCVMAVSASVEVNIVHNLKKMVSSQDGGDLALKFLAKRFPRRWRDNFDITSGGEKLDGKAPALGPTSFVIVDAATATPVEKQQTPTAKNVEEDIEEDIEEDMDLDEGDFE